MALHSASATTTLTRTLPGMKRLDKLACENGMARPPREGVAAVLTNQLQSVGVALARRDCVGETGAVGLTQNYGPPVLQQFVNRRALAGDDGNTHRHCLKHLGRNDHRRFCGRAKDPKVDMASTQLLDERGFFEPWDPLHSRQVRSVEFVPHRAFQLAAADDGE